MQLKLKDILDCDQIERSIVENKRWTIVIELIFEYNYKTYKTYYHEAATEQQEGSGTDRNELLDCEVVIEKEVLVKQWVSI